MVSVALIVILLIVIIAAVYLVWYYRQPHHKSNKYSINRANSPKKVRFQDNVQVRSYRKSPTQSNDIIDAILSDKSGLFDHSEHKSPTNVPDRENPTTWHQAFAPIIDKQQTAIVNQSIMQEHHDYNNAVSKFSQYQLDKESLIEPEFKIDPFSDEGIKSSRGKTIAEIYDQQTAGIKFKPKKIVKESDGEIIYQNELDINGGQISGSGLSGYSEGNFHKTAYCGDEF